MAPIQYLKRFAPNTPGWLLWGLVLVVLVWVIVLPLEIFEAAIGRDFFLAPFSVWLVRSVYMLGLALSAGIVSDFSDTYALTGPFRMAAIILGLLISSLAYFLIGAMLSTKKPVIVVLALIILIAFLVNSLIMTVMFAFPD
jgi:hypothetical protein